MTETLLVFISEYGVGVLWLATFLSCLAMPIPSSFLMLAGGAFVTTGDLSLTWTVAAALSGAILGDQVGFWLGQRGGYAFSGWLHKPGPRAELMSKANRRLEQHGPVSVFLTRWLFSPLGPYVNFLAGLGGLRWSRFTPASVLGETAWVSIYVGLGMAFANSFTMIAEMASNVLGILAAGLVSSLAGRFLWKRAQNGEKP